MADELRAYEQVAKETAGRFTAAPANDDRIARAEEGFARALSAVGGVELAASGARGAEELKTVRRDQAGAAELARFKAEVEASPVARRGRRD